MDIEQHRRAPADADVVFFDRAIPDALWMLHDLGLLSRADAERSIATFPYCRPVFVAPPWQEIYATDSERDQRYDESVRVYRRASEWYDSLGFELIELPRVSVDDRCEFVLRTLRSKF